MRADVYMKRPKNVDQYIAAAPKELRGKLKQLRAIIKSAAPKADEKISYNMPYYGYKGRLAYFMLHTHHIGLYITPPIVTKYQRDLKNYYSKGATIRLPLDKKLPVALIKKLIKARVRLNDAKQKK